MAKYCANTPTRYGPEKSDMAQRHTKYGSKTPKYDTKTQYIASYGTNTNQLN